MPDSSSPIPPPSGDENTPNPLHLEEDLWHLGEDFIESQEQDIAELAKEHPKLPSAPARGHVKTIGTKTALDTTDVPANSSHQKPKVKVLGSSQSSSPEKGFVAKKSVNDEELRTPLLKRKRREIEDQLQSIARSAELPEFPETNTREVKKTTLEKKKVVEHLTANTDLRNESQPLSEDPKTTESAFDDLSSHNDEPHTASVAQAESPVQEVSHPKENTNEALPTQERLGELLESPNHKPLATPKNPSFTKGEKLSLTALIAGIFAFAVFAVVSITNKIVLTEDDRKSPEFPLKGHIITIDKVTTSWRAPRSGGDSPDPVNVDDAFIPVATIKFSDDMSDSTVRLFFQNDEGAIVGDPTTMAVTGGQVVELAGTKGFEYLGGLNGYIDREIDAWHVIIAEVSASGAQTAVTKLPAIPISSHITE